MWRGSFITLCLLVCAIFMGSTLHAQEHSHTSANVEAGTLCIEGHLACSVQAQPQDIKQTEKAEAALSLDQALMLASQHAPLLEVADAELHTAQAARMVASERPNPELTMEAENVAGRGLYRGTRSMEATMLVDVPVELGGKRSARIGVADAEAQHFLIQTAMAHTTLRFMVTQAYAEAIAARQRLTTAQDQARIAEEELRATRSHVKAGRASPIEVQRAELERINAHTQTSRQQRLADLAEHSLSAIIGQPVPGQLDQEWFAHINPVRALPAPSRGADTLAMAAADAQLAIADAGARLAQTQRVPDVTIGAGVRYLRETNDTAAVLRLSIPLPLFSRGKAGVTQAMAEQQQARAQQRLAAFETDQAMAQAQTEAANAAMAAQMATGPALAAAQETVRIARIGYREGTLGQLDLLDAEKTLVETRRAAIDALLEYHIARAELERLSAGRSDTSPNATSPNSIPQQNRP